MLKRLTVINFRNHKLRELAFEPGNNFIYGENASGKTSVLEAICLSLLCWSFRTADAGETVNFGAEQATIESQLSAGGEEMAACGRFRTLISRTGEKLVCFINGEKKNKADLIGLRKLVFFTPDDLQAIKAGPQLRRRGLDIGISQIDREYFRALKNYRRIIRQRNVYLRNCRGMADRMVLDAWDRQMAMAASLINERRCEAVEVINGLCREIMGQIVGRDEISVVFEQERAGWEYFYRRWQNEREKDLVRGYTGWGPHRDNVKIRINGNDARAFASQGQQRSVAVVLKLAEAEFIGRKTGCMPLLLLDDIFSELDGNRRKSLLAYLADRNIQVIITGTDRESCPSSERVNAIMLD
ncbi:MAG: DNA replication/repair protein RecF [Negativicutes bacterium]|nr:DNA replication/repair protein RecF [Negativicutes bacterium]